jgi:hypothetical protein
MKQGFFYTILFLLFCGIVYNFWLTEWKYLSPTPIPSHYVGVAVNEKIELDSAFFSKDKPIFLHFFSVACPCSKFNIAHFKNLVETYHKDINFYAVLFAEDTTEARQYFNEKYNLSIPLVIKEGNLLAEKCGVYSTPQAVIINTNQKLFFRGNYNKTRYCTDKATNFAEIAIQEILAKHHPPIFDIRATRAYGCEIPDVYTNKN